MPNQPPDRAPDHRATGRTSLIRKPSPADRQREAALYGEIAARLIELHDGQDEYASPMGRTPLIWVLRAARLASQSPQAFWLYLRLQSGDTSDLSATYDEIARKTFRLPSNVLRELEDAIAVLKMHYPELATAITGLRARFRVPRGMPSAQSTEQPQGKNQGTSASA